MKRTKETMRHLSGIALTVLVVCVMFICISATALAAQGKVTCDPAAKIRETASTSSNQVGSAQNGAVLEIVSEVTGSDGKVWYQVSFEGNKTGYIRSDLMQKLADTPTNPPSTVASEVQEVQPVTCTVTGGQVNVRSNASTGGDKVAQVQRGEVMTIDGTATDSEGKVWYRVNFSADGGNKTGFVRYDFVTVSGEIKPIEEVETPPEVDPPTEEPPAADEPVVVPTLSKDYDTVQEDGVWYLIDNVVNKRYILENVMDAAIKNPQIYDDMEKKVRAQKGWITFLIFLALVMMVGITLLVLKLKDVMDEAYFTAVEKNTLRQKQEQKSGQRQGAPQGKRPAQGSGQQKNVMHTVGGGAQKQGTPTKTTVPKMNIAKTGEGTPQMVKVSNPADTQAPKPITQRTLSQKSAENKQDVTEDTKVMPAIGKQEPKKTVDSSKQTWQSKNFMTDDDDDDFEYGFLDWDEGEE